MDQRCGRCYEWLPEQAFSPAYRGKLGRWCRACYAAHHRGELRPPRPTEACTQCGRDFVPRKVTADSLSVCSRECKDERRKALGRPRAAHLLRKYGITETDYDRMLTEQGGGCAICKTSPEALTAGRYRTFLHVDHSHETGKVRGLLCPDCNLKLGQWNDDASMFRRAADYLER